MLNWLESKCTDIFIVKSNDLCGMGYGLNSNSVFRVLLFVLYLFKTVPLLKGAINTYLDKRWEFS